MSTPSTSQPTAPDALRASGLMLASALLFGLMSLTIRLASAEIHPFEIAFFRNLFGLLFALPLLYRAGFSVLKTDRIGLYFIRCVVGLSAMLTGFWSLVHLPLAQAVALGFTTPLFVTIGAVFFLGEIVRARRWSAVIIGFFGALIIIKPWSADLVAMLAAGTLIALASALLSASAAISVKFLARTEPALAIVIYMVLIMTPLSLIPALYVWTWPSPTSWCWLALTGGLGTFAHMLMTRAFQLGDVSALTPINFVQLPVVAIGAWLLFAESLDRYTLIGAMVIFSSTIYIAHRERVLARRIITDAQISQEAKINR
jgi:drug/metabolite transporter (DMT)-like permease